jgi:hypothetical protein
VGTVCWIGAVIFVGLQDVSQNVAGSKYIYTPGDPRRYEPYDPQQGIDVGRSVRMSDGSELYFHRSIRLYDDAQNIDPILVDFWEQRWLRYWSYIFPWLLLAALPGLLFIVVYTILWVADGFGAA